MGMNCTFPKYFVLLCSFLKFLFLKTTTDFVFLVILTSFAFLLQRRQGQSSFQSKSELFHSHREEAHSGLLVAPPKQPRPVKEVRTGEPEHLQKRVSHSGPLVNGPRWTKSGKELDAPSAVPTAANLSKMSGLVATRTLLLSEDHQEKSGPTQPDTTQQLGRFSGSVSELESRRKQDHKHHSQTNGDFYKIDGKARTKEPSLVSYFSCFFLRLFLIYLPQVLSNILLDIDKLKFFYIYIIQHYILFTWMERIIDECYLNKSK